MKLEDKRKQSIRKKYKALKKVRYYIDIGFFLTIFVLALLQEIAVILIIIPCYFSFLGVIALIYKIWKREAPSFIMELKIDELDEIIDVIEAEKQDLIDQLEEFEYDN